MIKSLKIFILAVFVLMVFVSNLFAAEGGYSNYVPGTYGDFAAAVEPPTQWTIRNDYYHYQADGGRSIRSGLLSLDMDLEMNIDFLTVLYKSDLEFLGGRYATGVFLPMVVNVDLEAGISVLGSRVARQGDVTNFGDATFIPGVLYWNKGNFHFALAEYIITPTGDYDKNNLVNAGLNYWTFDTDFAVTYLNENTGQDYSINLGYNYNTENPDTDYQTGEEIHIDYMVNQFFSETFAVGVHGFYLKQISGDSGSGATLGGFKAEASGVGPAVLWATKIFDQDVTFIAKWLHEYDAQRRLEGDHVMVSLATGF